MKLNTSNDKEHWIKLLWIILHYTFIGYCDLIDAFTWEIIATNVIQKTTKLIALINLLNRKPANVSWISQCYSFKLLLSNI